MKTTKPKLAAKASKVKAAPPVASKGGLKEQVRSGLITASQALKTLGSKDSHAQHSKTYRWLQARASKESIRKEANVEVQG